MTQKIQLFQLRDSDGWPKFEIEKYFLHTKKNKTPINSIISFILILYIKFFFCYIC